MNYFIYTSFPVKNLKINFNDQTHLNLLKYFYKINEEWGEKELWQEYTRYQVLKVRKLLNEVFTDFDKEDLSELVTKNYIDLTFRIGESTSVEENFKNNTFEWITINKMLNDITN
ncbi:MAG TPA: hypothetical protein EYQ00_12010 [Dehalococcoidia bacterium]|nr:hypothetical protein [Dehalococcoidia bacterium]